MDKSYSGMNLSLKHDSGPVCIHRAGSDAQDACDFLVAMIFYD